MKYFIHFSNHVFIYLRQYLIYLLNFICFIVFSISSYFILFLIFNPFYFLGVMQFFLVKKKKYIYTVYLIVLSCIYLLNNLLLAVFRVLTADHVCYLY